MLSIRTLIICLVALFSGALQAAELEPADSSLVNERPNAAGAATEIQINLFVFDIDYINDVSQRFNIDMFVAVAWQDERLALADAAPITQMRSAPLSEVWTPGGLIVNDRGLSTQLPRIVTIDPQGNIIYRQRFSGELAVNLLLRDFPSDSQRLSIDFVSYQYPPEEVRFSVNSNISSRGAAFSAEGWDFALLEPVTGTFDVPDIGITRPRLTFFIEAVRDSQYYLLTMFLPMSLIILMSWTVFWLQPTIIPSRIAISTASIFSLMAVGFSVRVGLPKVSYMTRADVFVIGCTLLVVLALSTVVIGSRWASDEKIERALKLNAAARWVYVAMFCAVALVASRF